MIYFTKISKYGDRSLMKSLCAKINWLKWFNRLLIFFFLFLLLFLTNFHALSWNDSSRFATIQNLVENKSFIINNAYYERGTHDKVFINGFYYSDKPPLFSVEADRYGWQKAMMTGCFSELGGKKYSSN